MKFLFLFLFALSFMFGDNLMLKLQKLIDNRSEKSVEILKYDPFFRVNDVKKTADKKTDGVIEKKRFKRRDLNLVTILDHKAFVSGKWVAKNDIISGYIVKEILKDRVVLVNNRKKVILRFNKTKKILKVRER